MSKRCFALMAQTSIVSSSGSGHGMLHPLLMPAIERGRLRRALWLWAVLGLAASCGKHQRPFAPAPQWDATQAAARALKDESAQAEQLFEQGLRYENEGQYDRAVQAFEQAIAAVNAHYPSWLHRGRVELLRNQPSAALMFLELAVGLRPNDPDALQWRGDAHLRLGDARKAIADYDRALALTENMFQKAALYASRAEAHLMLHEEGRALDDYTSAIRWRPAAADPYYRRGLLLEKMGRIHDALQEFRIAVVLQPDHEQARRELERVTQRIAQLPAAAPQTPAPPTVAAVKPSASSPPAPQAAPTPERQKPPPAHMAPAHLAKETKPLAPAAPAPVAPSHPPQPKLAGSSPQSAGAAREAKARWSAALELIYSRQEWRAIGMLDEAIRLKPDFAQAYNARGFAWLLLRRYQEAIADFDAALRIDPNYANAQHNRKVAIEALQRAARARVTSAALHAAPAAIRPAASKTPGQANGEAATRWRKARELIGLGRVWEAIEELNAAIALKPDYAQAFNARGYAWLLLRQYQRAIADFDRALEILPDYANAAHNRAVALRAAGETAKR